MREPEEKLIKLPERFWALKNHVGILVAILQSCQVVSASVDIAGEEKVFVCVHVRVRAWRGMQRR